MQLARCSVVFFFEFEGLLLRFDEEEEEESEWALRSKMKQKALKECDQYTSKYAQCASGKTISVVWQCRKQAKELNDCLHQFYSVVQTRYAKFKNVCNSVTNSGSGPFTSKAHEGKLTT
ncbi:hypothetical protein AHAS_Ahas14G0260400 [Arachis hypogaea]